MINEITPMRKLLPLFTCVPLAAALGCGGGSEQSASPSYPQAEPGEKSVPATTSQEPPEPPAEPQPDEAAPASSPEPQPSEEPAAPSGGGGGDPWGSSKNGTPAEPQAGASGIAPDESTGSPGASSKIGEQELTQFARTYAEVVTVQRKHQRKARSAASRDELQAIQGAMEDDIQAVIEQSPLSRTRFDTLAQAVNRNESLRSRLKQKMRTLR